MDTRSCAIGPVIVTGVLLTVVTGCSNQPAPPPMVIPDSKTVKALGRLEPRGGIINVGLPPGDRIERIVVAEGADVKHGQPLAYLASRTARELEYDLAKSQHDEAVKRLAVIEASGQAQIAEARIHQEQIEQIEPLEITSLENKVGLLQLQLTFAADNLKRVEALKTDAVPRQELEQARLTVRQAQTEKESAESQLKKLRQGHGLNVKAAQAQLVTAKANLERLKQEFPLDSLKQTYKLAEERLRQTVITAPTDGLILKILTRAGETAGPQPLLRLADVRQMVAVAEVYETDVSRLRCGQQATITSRALQDASPKHEPLTLTGTVEQVSQVVSRNHVFDINPAEDADRRVVEVRVLLNQPEQAVKFINLQVHVSISLEETPKAKEEKSAARGIPSRQYAAQSGLGRHGASVHFSQPLLDVAR